MSPQPRASSRLLTPERAVLAAARVATELKRHPLWEPALTRAKAVMPALLVHRIDVADSYYYAVPCVDEGRVTARVLIDGFAGQLLEIGAVSAVAPSLRKWISPHEAVAVVQSNVEVRREALTVPSVLSWRPCAESRSRFLPFYSVVAADRIVYVRVDAKFYTALTTGFRG